MDNKASPNKPPDSVIGPIIIIRLLVVVLKAPSALLPAAVAVVIEEVGREGGRTEVLKGGRSGGEAPIDMTPVPPPPAFPPPTA